MDNQPLSCKHAGLGNLVTGVLGAGYTGSYIFSQTLFAMRAGVATRLHSWIIAAMELGMFALPFSVRASQIPLQCFGLARLTGSRPILNHATSHDLRQASRLKPANTQRNSQHDAVRFVSIWEVSRDTPLVQVVQYLPNFFFAALLMLLGVEITLDWLILSVRKVSRAEYCLLLASFLAILQRESVCHTLRCGVGIKSHYYSMRVAGVEAQAQLVLAPYVFSFAGPQQIVLIP